jgi:hypothetical protein
MDGILLVIAINLEPAGSMRPEVEAAKIVDVTRVCP